MKTFDWEFSATQHKPESIALLKEYHDKKLSEEEFVKLWTALPRIGGKNKTGNRNNSRRTPSFARRQYHSLKERFGFFI